MLVGILCRMCRCLVGGSREPEPSVKPTGDAVREERAETAGRAPGESPQGSVDDLTAIRGIGITKQDRLNRAGITTYAQLAVAKPEQVREALGRFSRGAHVEEWISRARELAARK